MLSDMLQAFDRWEEWKAMRAAPKRIDALEKRVSDLETELARRPKAEACPICGSEFKVTHVRKHPQLGNFGVQIRELGCSNAECGHIEERVHDPLGRMGPKKG